MDPTIAGLVTIAGLTPVVVLINYALLRAANAGTAARDRFGPILSIVVGIVVAEGATAGLGLIARQDVANAALIGLLSGGNAMGLYDLIKSATAPSAP
jgi:hypothetical protein